MSYSEGKNGMVDGKYLLLTGLDMSEYNILISSALFLHYSQLFPLFQNNSRILNTIKIPKVIPT